MKKEESKQLSVQHVVDYLGDEIVKHNLSGSLIKGIGEVEINQTMYQIQIHLESDKSNWINESGVLTPQKSKSWITKFLNLFTSTTDVEIQK